MSLPVLPLSTVTAVRQYLVAQFITACSGFTDPSVEVYLSQADHESSQDLVIVGGAHRQTPTVRFVGSGGPMWQDEIYTIDVEIACFIAGNNPFPDVDIRAYAILVACEQAVRADPSAGGLVVQMNPDASESTHDWEDSELGGGHCNISLTVAVVATY